MGSGLQLVKALQEARDENDKLRAERDTLQQQVKRAEEETRESRLYLKGCMGHFFDETPLSAIAKDVAAEFHRGTIREQEQRASIDKYRTERDELSQRIEACHKTVDRILGIPEDGTTSADPLDMRLEALQQQVSELQKEKEARNAL